MGTHVISIMNMRARKHGKQKKLFIRASYIEERDSKVETDWGWGYRGILMALRCVGCCEGAMPSGQGHEARAA